MELENGRADSETSDQTLAGGLSLPDRGKGGSSDRALPPLYRGVSNRRGQYLLGLGYELPGALGGGHPGVPPRDRDRCGVRQSVQRHRGLLDAAGPAGRVDLVARKGQTGQTLRTAAVPLPEPGADLCPAGALVAGAPRVLGGCAAWCARRPPGAKIFTLLTCAV